MDNKKILEEIVDGIERTALVAGMVLLPGVEVPFQYINGKSSAEGYTIGEAVPLSLWYGLRNMLYTRSYVSEQNALAVFGATLIIEAASYAAGYFQFKSQIHKQKYPQN